MIKKAGFFILFRLKVKVDFLVPKQRAKAEYQIDENEMLTDRFVFPWFRWYELFPPADLDTLEIGMGVDGIRFF